MTEKPVRDPAVAALDAALGLKYFRAEEFACRCGCGAGALEINPELLRMLDRARDLSGVPYRITSGFRCPAHNRAEGGSGSSSHLSGHAADIAVANDRQRGAVLMGLINAGFRRIGIAKTFIHVDIDPRKGSGAVWLYS